MVPNTERLQAGSPAGECTGGNQVSLSGGCFFSLSLPFSFSKVNKHILGRLLKQARERPGGRPQRVPDHRGMSLKLSAAPLRPSVNGHGGLGPVCACPGVKQCWPRSPGPRLCRQALSPDEVNGGCSGVWGGGPAAFVSVPLSQPRSARLGHGHQTHTQ